MKKNNFFSKQILSLAMATGLILVGIVTTTNAQQFERFDRGGNQGDRFVRRHGHHGGHYGPGPIYPPRPIYPVPVPTPIPVYPHPVPQPPYYDPGYTFERSVFVNRWVQYESLNLAAMLNLGYDLSRYRIRSVFVKVGSTNRASIDLLLNGRVVDSKQTYGENVYLYSRFNNGNYTDFSTLRLGVTGAVFIQSVTVQFERNY